MLESQPSDGDGPVPRYVVVLGARLDPSWSGWFDDMQLQPTPDGHTVLTGSVPDQAALHGLLTRIRDLGVELLALSRLDET